MAFSKRNNNYYERVVSSSKPTTRYTKGSRNNSNPDWNSTNKSDKGRGSEERLVNTPQKTKHARPRRPDFTKEYLQKLVEEERQYITDECEKYGRKLSQMSKNSMQKPKPQLSLSEKIFWPKPVKYYNPETTEEGHLMGPPSPPPRNRNMNAREDPGSSSVPRSSQQAVGSADKKKANPAHPNIIPSRSWYLTRLVQQGYKKIKCI